MDRLSDEEKKQLEQRLRKLGEEYRNRRRKAAALVNPAPSPRYDDVYFEGLAWLDSLAGPPLVEGEYEVVFSDDSSAKAFFSEDEHEDEFSDDED